MYIFFKYLKKLGNNILCLLIELMYEKKNTKGVYLRSFIYFTSFCQVIEVFILQIEIYFS